MAVVGPRGVVRLMVRERLDRAAASAKVREWLHRGIRKSPALKREARTEEAFLAWFPFVRTRVDVVGWVLGWEERRERSGGKSRTVKRPVERQVERHVDRTCPSADMAEFGVERVDLSGDEIEPLDLDGLRARGMVFSPSAAPAELADRLAQEAMAEIQTSSRVDKVSFSWFATVRRQVTLVYYPLWVFRYSFRDRTYQALVDAEDGSLAYGKAPGNHLYRAGSLVAATAGACFLGTSLLQHLGIFLRSDEGLAGLGAVGLLLLGTVHWGYSQFRHGGVVEEGTGLDRSRRHRGLAQTIRRALERG